jgi:DNA repair ATPase RecN
MSQSKNTTASFVVRFNQHIFQSEEGEPDVQWRGSVRHVQDGEEKRFSDVEDLISFLQSKLTDLTLQATEDKSPEEQKGILSKSLELWKQLKEDYPKKVIDTIKDPLGSVEQLQEQVQEQVHQISDRIRPNLDPDSWKPATKNDLKTTNESLLALAKAVQTLAEKVDRLAETD